MADKVFYLEVLTPESTIFKGEVTSLVIPAELGYLGVLAGHAPLIARLRDGKIILKSPGHESEIFLNQGKGFAHVLSNRVTLLLSSCQT